MDKRYLKATTVLGMLTGASVIAGMSSTPARAWTDNSLSNFLTCNSVVVVNDVGTVAGTCELPLSGGGDGNYGFVRLNSARSSTTLAALTSTPGGQPCSVSGINNAAAGLETIIGGCTDGNSVQQGVFWMSASPATPPTLLQPLSLLNLGLLPDVETQANVVNTAGVIIGVSISSNGTMTPVSWSSTGAPTQLAAPLLSVNTNCVPTDINEASTPSVVGTCPGTEAQGGSQAVLWRSTTSAYTVLPVPTGFSHCEALKINLSGQILGSCWAGGDQRKLALWGPGGTGPLVQASVGGTPAYTWPVALNVNGLVACGYQNLVGGASVDAPCVWDTSNGNTVASSISFPGTSDGAGTSVGVGNNGKIVGSFELLVQDAQEATEVHSFHCEPTPLGQPYVAVDDGDGVGGGESTTTWVSKNAIYMAAKAQDANEMYHAMSQQVP